MQLWAHILLYNLILSVYLYASLAIDPRMWLHRMPPEVRAKVPPKTEAERKRLIPLGVPFLILMIGYPVWYTAARAVSSANLTGGPAGYFHITGLLFLFFLSFDLWDTLVLDLLIFCGITPQFIIIEGSNRGDYKNVRYHLKSGAKGLIFLTAGALILGGALFLGF